MQDIRDFCGMFVTDYAAPVIIYIFFIISDKCTVPPHPNNGWYSLMDGGMLAPGDVMDQYTLIKVNCKNNFVPEKNNTSHLCYVGQWSPPAIETCVGKCFFIDLCYLNVIEKISIFPCAQ